MKKNSKQNLNKSQKFKLLIIEFIRNIKYDMSQFYLKFKKSIQFILILLISIFLVISIFNLTYNLHFYKSPKISIEPMQVYKTLKNNESEQINFTASSKTNFLCNSKCTYDFIDRSTSEILKNASIEKNGFIDVTINGPNIGSGVLVYNLEITCINKKSIFCPYDNNLSESKKSSFVVLSYDLTEDEKSFKEEIRPELLKLLLKLNEVNYKFENLNNIVFNPDITFFDKIKIIENLALIKNNIEKINSNVEKYIIFWENEEYLQISLRKIKENNEKLEIYSSQLAKKENEIDLNIKHGVELAKRYNSQLDDLTNLTINYEEDLKLKILPSTIFLSFENASNKISNLSSSFSNISNLSYDSYEKQFEDFETDLDIFEFEVLKFNKNISNIKNEIMTYENNKRCHIDNCLSNNLTNIQNFCSSLNLILNNDSYKYYEFKDEIYNYNNTYYNKDGRLYLCNLDENITCKFNESTYLKFNNDNLGKLINFEDVKIILLDEENYNIIDNKIQIIENENLSTNYFNLCSKNEFKFNTSNFSKINYFGFNLTNINISNQSKFNTELVEHLPKCCVNGMCTTCCMNDECRTDKKTYPLLLVHGHSFLRNSPAEPISDMFNKIEYQLILNGYIDGGTLEFNGQKSYNKDWSYLNLPIVLKTNYYYESYYDVGSYVYIVKSDESIDNYAIRFSENVNNVKKITGRPKVNIIAHSMGGLVVRRYMQIFGVDSIDKVILIGTPNQGVEGRVDFLCSVVGEKLECKDMKKNSILMSKLNDPNYTPNNVKIYTISGIGCETNGKDGDGIVTLDSSILPYSQKSYLINGTCKDLLRTELHKKLLDIDAYPEVYDNILEILNE